MVSYWITTSKDLNPVLLGHIYTEGTRHAYSLQPLSSERSEQSEQYHRVG